MAFSFRQIQYFVAVAENGAISRAAQSLSISQSTVTEALRELELDLGFSLFDRWSHGVELSLKGHQFLRHAHKILSDIADARLSLKQDSSPITGRLALGVSPLVASYVLPDVLARFRRAFPAVTIEIIEDGREHLEHLLLGGELDVVLAICGPNTNDAAFQIELIDTSRYRVWMPLGHRLAALDAIDLAALESEAFVLLVQEEIAVTAELAWRRAHIRPPVTIRTRSVEAARSLVATGAGVAILPDLIYRPWSLDGDRIEAREITQSFPAVEVALVWRRGLPPSVFTSQFVTLARTHRVSRARLNKPQKSRAKP